MDEHCILSIFGATGDLANRKLLPALYYLEKEGLLKKEFRVVCIARRQKTDEECKKDVEESIKKFSRVKINEDVSSKFVSRISYQKLEFSSIGDYANLKELMEKIAHRECSKCERIFYLAVPSEFFKVVVGNLRAAGLVKRQSSMEAYNRIMFEKPFGHDLISAKELNKSITSVFDEKQIYRIDHYMAKELVQNLLVLRFAKNFAIDSLAFGGVYIAGGIAPKNRGIFDKGFVRIFENNYKLPHVLRKIPVYLVLNSDVGLLGAGSMAKFL